MEQEKPPSPGFEESQKDFDRPEHEGWPNSFRTREELDAMIEAGLASGISDRTFEEIVASALARVKRG